MTRFHRAMSSPPLSLVPSRARRSSPVRPNDERSRRTVNARTAGRPAANRPAARTRALILPSSPEWRTLWLAGAAGMIRAWRGLTGRPAKR